MSDIDKRGGYVCVGAEGFLEIFISSSQFGYKPKISLKIVLKKTLLETSLVVQWLWICPAMQETWIQSLVGELRFHMPWNNEVHSPQLLKSTCHD